jgi:membrane dipeptidase
MTSAPTRSPAAGDDARSLYERAIVVDALGGSVLRRPPPEIDGADVIDQRRAGGITLSNETLASDNETFRAAAMAVYAYLTLAQVERERLLIVERVHDIHRAKREGRHGLILGLQGGTAFEDEVGTVFLFQKLGIRIAGLAYNRRTLLGDGCYERDDQGLTVHGRRVVLAMNEAGITVDLSHVGQLTAIEATEVSAKPLIYSHSNCSALTPHVRNISDEQLRAIASNGGVVGVGPHSVFCERQSGVRPTIADFIDHIEHVAEVAGVDHVGIGTDMFGGETLSERVFRAQFSRVVPAFFGGYGISEKFVLGFERSSDFPKLAEELTSRGFSDDDIVKVLGSNFIRVFEATWSPN